MSQDQPAVAAHCFKEGMKLEAVDPTAPISIRPATVTKVSDFPVSFDIPMLPCFCPGYGFVPFVVSGYYYELNLVNSLVRNYLPIVVK